MNANPTDAGHSAEDQQRALVEKILKSGAFSRADRSKSVLSFLFDRHCEHPGVNVPESEICHEVFGADNSDFAATVRVAVGRLRTLLDKYFLAEGVNEAIRLQITKNGYSLVFKPKPYLPDPIGWFWENYFRQDSPLLLGVIQPNSGKVRDPETDPYKFFHAALLFYNAISAMTAARELEVEILPRDWQETPELLNNRAAILLSTDDFIRHNRFDADFSPLGGPVLEYLGYNYPIQIFRDPANRLCISVDSPEAGRSPILFEDTSKEGFQYALLFRDTNKKLESQTDLTIIVASDLATSAIVAEFLTTASGLEAVALRDDIKDTVFRGPGLPDDFQVLFKVMNTCQQDASEERLRGIKIDQCKTVHPFEILRPGREGLL